MDGKIILEKDKYIWWGPYETHHYPKNAGFKWNKTYPRWETKYVEIAGKLVDHAIDHELYIQITSQLIDRVENQIQSSASISDAEIPSPPGLDYYPFQKAGIMQLHKLKKVLLADEMGLGKSIQAVGLLNKLHDFGRVLIICPASLKINWNKELERWLIPNKSISVLYSKNPEPDDSDILIVNYKLLSSNNFRWLREINFDIVIADEAHKIKNPKSLRGKSFKIIAKKANRLVLLSGTPIPNRPIELWPLLDLLDFNMNYFYYIRRYCDAQQTNFGWDTSGAANLSELQERLRGEVMIRRLKSDVLTELPEKTRQIIYIDPSKYTGLLNKEQQVLKSYINFQSVEYDDAVRLLEDMPPSSITELSKIRHELGVEKIRDVIDHINLALEYTNKIIVFAHHRDVLHKIQNYYHDNSVMLAGGMSEKNKDLAVQEFQNNDDINLFIGQITAAGVGLTLTKANLVIFVELDWTPGNMEQAEDRAHRIGQTKNVLIQHLVVDGSIDSKMTKLLIEKQEIIKEALN